MTNMREERSISQLFGDSLFEFTKLVRNEIDLARAEVVEKVSVTTGAAKYVGLGLVLIIPALVMILLAIAAELVVLGLSQPLAYLCSGVGAAVVAGIVIWVGLSRLSAKALKPSRTLDELQRDKVMAAELMR